MGDGDAKAKQPALPAGAPKDLTAFLDCTAATVTLRGGTMGWVGKLDLGVTEIEPDITFTAGENGAINISVGKSFLALTLPATITAGQLTVDASSLPDKAADFVKGWVNDLNGWLKSKGKQFGAAKLDKGAVTLTKVAIPAPAATKPTDPKVKDRAVPPVPDQPGSTPLATPVSNAAPTGSTTLPGGGMAPLVSGPVGAAGVPAHVFVPPERGELGRWRDTGDGQYQAQDGQEIVWATYDPATGISWIDRSGATRRGPDLPAPADVMPGSSPPTRSDDLAQELQRKHRLAEDVKRHDEQAMTRWAEALAAQVTREAVAGAAFVPLPAADTVGEATNADALDHALDEIERRKADDVPRVSVVDVLAPQPVPDVLPIAETGEPEAVAAMPTATGPTVASATPSSNRTPLVIAGGGVLAICLAGVVLFSGVLGHGASPAPSSPAPSNSQGALVRLSSPTATPAAESTTAAQPFLAVDNEVAPVACAPAGTLHVNFVIANVPAGSTVVVAFTGPGVPATVTFTTAADGSFSKDFTVPGSGTWTDNVVSVNGQPLTGNTKNSASSTCQ